jgi:hypothetical protein
MPKGPVVLNVTQEDIDQAKPKDSSHCMIADTIRRTIPEASRISVDLATIRYSDGPAGKRYVFLTPQAAQQRLLWFDQADPQLKPFKFTLPRPVQTVKTKEAKRTGRKVRGIPDKGKATIAKIGGGAVPEKRGGKTPPLGALARGAGSAQAHAAAAKRREAAAAIAPKERSISVRAATPRTKREERVLVSSGRIRGYGLRRMGVA